MNSHPKSNISQCPFSNGKMLLKEIIEESSDQNFAREDSIVRKIWGKSDTILFIFAGAAAEFALNKAVDWLYFTGKLPNDPIGRLFSTVEYARKIVFATTENAHYSIDTIRKIHTAVEKKRGFFIPDWAYRDVLFMLIYYSIAAFELLERKLSNQEKEEIYNVFYRLGNRMGLKELPENYENWLPARKDHLKNNLEKSDFTIDLFEQYKKHLGAVRFSILLECQKLLVPDQVKKMLKFNRFSILSPEIPIYRFSRKWNADEIIKKIIMPTKYQIQIQKLNVNR